MSKAFLSPKELAQALGVGESTLKRWVDDGLLAVQRTAGGHRRIPLSEAARFVRVSRHPVRCSASLGLGLAVDEIATVSSLDERFHEALLNGDSGRCRCLLVGAFLSGRTVASLCDGPIRLGMCRLGDLWQHSPEGIAIEHHATTICMQALEQLRLLLPVPAADAPLALGGGRGCDPYFLPSLMAAAILNECGYRTVNLGALTAPAVLAAGIKRYQPQLVWRALSFIDHAGACRAELVKLAADIAPVPLVVGGRLLAEVALVDHANLHTVCTMAEFAAYANGLRTAGERPTRRRRAAH